MPTAPAEGVGADCAALRRGSAATVTYQMDRLPCNEIHGPRPFFGTVGYHGKLYHRSAPLALTRPRSIVVLTGAGISAESGIRTFRDSGGLWEDHDIEEVATYKAYKRTPRKVLEFYNARRRDLQRPDIAPNAAHLALAEFERDFPV